jgi:phosphoribosylanthranilate isomerase
MAEAKVCGMADRDGLDAALTHGARFVGLVFYGRSPRNVTLDRAAALARIARGRTDIVAVTVDADDAALAAICEAVAPDWLQLHGKEPPARSAAVRRFAIKGVIRAIAVSSAADFETVAPHADAADMLLFDAKAPAGAALPGGNGAAFDWTLLTGRTFSRPWFLSGGLDAANVGRAIAASGAMLVDASSGVERAPGVKDPDRIAAFLAAVSAARR